MKKSFSLVFAALFLLSACSSPWGNKGEESTDVDPTQTEDEQEEQESISNQQELEENCEDSGGDYKNGTCNCPTDTYGSGETPIYTYNKNSGYCEDPDGAPGGVLGEDGKGALLDPRDL